MKPSLVLLNESLPSAAENLALDDALLEERDSGRISSDLLRLWESPEYAVVLGISGVIQDDIYLEQCQEAKIPILRRRSGGGTVLIGPGCLNYSLTLSYENWPAYQDLTHSYQGILNQVASALGNDCQLSGTSDLTQSQLKFSGNAQRRLSKAFIHHGTLLYNFDLEKISQFLKEPPKQPKYRHGRSHQSFIKNLESSSETIQRRLTEAFQAESNTSLPLPDYRRQLSETYLNDAWIFRK